jgi:hypothetical protein
MSILDLQGLPLPEVRSGAAMGPVPSSLSLVLCIEPGEARANRPRAPGRQLDRRE